MCIEEKIDCNLKSVIIMSKKTRHGMIVSFHPRNNLKYTACVVRAIYLLGEVRSCNLKKRITGIALKVPV